MTRRILIGTPVGHWMNDCRYTASLAATARLCLAHGIEQREIFEPGEAILAHARNKIWKAAVEHDFDDLIMIDDDQDWRPEWVVRLIGHPIDCVGIPVRKKIDEEAWNVRAPGGAASLVADPETGLWTAPGLTIGCGFIRFSKKALRALWDAAEPYLGHGDGETFRWVFDAGPKDTGKPIKELMSEDTFVGERLWKLGMKVWVDPTLCSGHCDGQKRYAGDFAAYIMRLRAAATSA